jgi:hypothetical protein
MVDFFRANIFSTKPKQKKLPISNIRRHKNAYSQPSSAISNRNVPSNKKNKKGKDK